MPTVFLLGGQDLEMQEIARLLDNQDILYFDRKLHWDNASLEAYLPELEKYGNLPGTDLYGIELQDNGLAEQYNNYFLIDHHNENQGKIASLLQVAELLHLSPTREQLLIAANDAAYIPGMIALDASPTEIEKIRSQDRAAQGITDEEERWAQQAIAENLEKCSDLFIVHTFCPRFSPICDRLWPYRKLLIYTNDVMCYYGEGKDRLTAVFEAEIRQSRMYHGGGNKGFLGTVPGKWNVEEIRQLKERISKIVQNL